MAVSDLVLVAGTRPEALKLEPLAVPLRDRGVVGLRCLWTGQHRRPPGDSSVDWLMPRPLHHPARRSTLLEGMRRGVAAHISARRTAAVVVQGDTLSALAAARAARDCRLPLIHLEAGLRSGNLRAPFPEEALRRRITRLAALHLAPSEAAVGNLLAEGVAAARIVQVGSTAVDRLYPIRPRTVRGPSLDILLDIHRREHFTRPLVGIVSALTALARTGLRVGYIEHPNPIWRGRLRDLLGPGSPVRSLPAMTQARWLDSVRQVRLLVSDSGGAAEEMPYLGVPLMVLRRATERREPIASGHAVLVSPDGSQSLETAIQWALCRRWPRPWPFSQDSPYGDGRAAERAAGAIADWLAREEGNQDARL